MAPEPVGDGRRPGWGSTALAIGLLAVAFVVVVLLTDWVR